MLSQKMEGFCLDIIKEIRPGQAYLNHYKVKSMAVASVCASKLLRKAKIEARIKELRQQAVNDSIATPIERKQVLTEIIRAEPGNYIKKDGDIVLTDENLKKRGLSEVKVTRGLSKSGDPWESRTIKLRDPIAAIETLNRMEGIGKETEGDRQTNNYVTQVNIYSNGHDSNKPFKEIIEGEVIRGNGNKRQNT